MATVVESLAASDPSIHGETPPRPSGRYRYPGDAVRLGMSGALLALSLALAFGLADELMGSRATAISVVAPEDSAFRLLAGTLQALIVLAPALLAVSLLRRRRFRLSLSLLAAGAVAALVAAGLDRLIGGGTAPIALAHGHAGSWLAGAAFPGPAMFAAATAVTVAVEPWLSRPWQRVAWGVVLSAAAVRLILGTVVPLELAVAMVVGTTVGLVLLVALGVPDRRLDAAGVAAALAAAGIDAEAVTPADVVAKGSRPFLATLPDGHRLFIKVLGTEQRTADLLYRVYRFIRLRNVGDVRSPASLMDAVEHQALVGLVAERAGVKVPRVERIIGAPDGSVLLVLGAVDGVALDRTPPERISDRVLRAIWTEVTRLHGAGIAHRSLRTGNILLDPDDRPWIVDFSFSRIDPAPDQDDMDVAELLASLSAVAGPERPVRSAAAVLGPPAVGRALKFLQPLALSASTRHAVAGQEGLLGRVRAAVSSASGEAPDEMAHVTRVRPRTLLTIAVTAGAFYFLLPQLANASDSWRAFRSADWNWVAFVLAMSAVTYLGAAIGVLGTVRQRLAFVPTLLTQLASSFVNRVTPANVGGMALNGRFLQKSGADAGTAVAGVGLNSLAGGAVHLVLITVFFAWAGRDLARTFKLPSGSKLLIVVAVVGVVAGVVLATRWGRRRLLKPVRRGVSSSLTNLREVGRAPGKLALLFGGSLLVTLGYIAAFAGAAQAYGSHVPIATLGAIYLGGTAVAAAAPTPGNLGALEAALAAGLTGVGLAPRVAVAIVLTYRLATYWLPIVPGWLSWRVIQRWGYL